MSPISVSIFVILALTVLPIFDPKPLEAAFWTVFRDYFRPEVVIDVIISGVVVDQTGTNVYPCEIW